MVIVKRTLNKYSYPPDKHAKAIDTVIKQAELIADMFQPDFYFINAIFFVAEKSPVDSL